MRHLRIALSLFCLVLLLPLAAAAEGPRSLLFQIGAGLGFPSYPAEVEDLFSYMDSLDGIDRIRVSLDLGLGIALSEETFFMARIDGVGDRLEDSYGDYLQMNSYLYSLGARHYPSTTGFYFEAGAGLARCVLDSSVFETSASDPGFGLGAAIGYDFDSTPRGLALALEAKYDLLRIEGESCGFLMLTANFCVK